MKLKYFVIFLFVISNIYAATRISGTIKNYNNQSVYAFYYLNNVELLLGKTNTDEKGAFSISDEINYKGVVRLFLPEKKLSTNVFVKNEPIEFLAEIDQNSIKMTHFEDKLNETYRVYNGNEEFKLKRNALNNLLNIYNSSEPFYKQTQKELNHLNDKFGFNLNSYPFLKYYVDIEENYIKYDPKNQSDASRVSEAILQHLANDNEYLESSNLMNQMLNLYLTYQVNKYTSSEEQVAAIRPIIDRALDETIIETSRGQNVLVGFIDLLKGYGLDYIAEEYIDKAESLTCTINDNLQSTIQSAENTKMGAQFQNFSFTNSIEGKNSLYDIKSDYKLVVFWGSFCPHCQQERPLLKAFYKELKDKGGELITFSIETNPAEYKNFIAQIPGYHDADFLYWTSPVITQYGIQGTPTFFVLDKDNKIIGKGSKLELVKSYIK